MKILLDCKIWCVKVDDTKERLGINTTEEDMWVPSVIDLSRAIGIKSSLGEEFAGSDKAVVYFENDRFITDALYENVKQQFIMIKQGL